MNAFSGAREMLSLGKALEQAAAFNEDAKESSAEERSSVVISIYCVMISRPSQKTEIPTLEKEFSVRASAWTVTLDKS